MSITHQSQSFKTYQFEEQSDITITPEEIISNQQQAEYSFRKAWQIFKQSQTDDLFEKLLHIVSIILRKGYSSFLKKQFNLMRQMMNYFTSLSNQLSNAIQSNDISHRMIFVLSLIGEMLKQQKTLLFPFTKKFLGGVFRIDSQIIEKCDIRKKVLAVIARQPKLIAKLNIQKIFKSSILQHFIHIDEQFTLLLFAKSIIDLIVKGFISFTEAEIKNYQIYTTICKIMNQKYSLYMIGLIKGGICQETMKKKLPSLDGLTIGDMIQKIK